MSNYKELLKQLKDAVELLGEHKPVTADILNKSLMTIEQLVEERDSLEEQVKILSESLHDLNTSIEDLKKEHREAEIELAKYRESGTPEDCMSRKEWMSVSIDTLRQNYIAFTEGMREYVAMRDAPKKRGRPSKRVETVDEV